MKCPLCGNEMSEKDFGGVTIDYCDNGCKAIWFDNYEIKKLDEKTEGTGESLNDALSVEYKERDRNKKLDCPHCNVTLHEHRYRNGKIKIDECYTCGGIFLEPGELKILREEFKDDATIESEVTEILKNNKEYVNVMANRDKDGKQRLINIFRFMK